MEKRKKQERVDKKKEREEALKKQLRKLRKRLRKLQESKQKGLLGYVKTILQHGKVQNHAIQ